MLGSFLDLIFPKYCVGCNKEGTLLCQTCQKQVTQKDLICPQCKKIAFAGLTHPICRRWYSLDGLWSFGAFEGVLRKSIQKLKYRWVTEHADILMDQVIEYLAISSPEFFLQIKRDRGIGWAIVPVPLHWQRQNWRGFNQSALIAKKLAESLGLPYVELLKRTKNTTSQTTYDAAARRLNIKNAFTLSPNISISSYPHILLIDDVWTTGSTLQECCFVLKKNGVKKVWGFTLAR
jgi:ComF family protein